MRFSPCSSRWRSRFHFCCSRWRLWFRFFQPAKPSLDKGSAYECGIAPTGDSWIQFKAHYYLYAILFLIFDVEILFLLPFAVTFTQLPAGAIFAMLLFIFLLVEGLVWAWHLSLIHI